MLTLNQRPTFQSPCYAPALRTPFRPLFPSLWDGNVGSWCPCLGVQDQIIDLSGYGNHGTRKGTGGANNLPQFVPDGAGGWALDFDGTDDWVDLKYRPGFSNNGGDFTISSWVKANTTSFETIVSGRWGGNGWVYIIFSNKVQFYATGWKSANSTISAGQWYHTIVTFTDQTDALNFYLNGSNDGSASAGSFSDTADLSIGAYDIGGNLFDGLIDDVRIYNRALSPEEIWILSGFGGNPELGRGVAFRTVDDTPFAQLAAAALGGVYRYRMARHYGVSL